MAKYRRKTNYRDKYPDVSKEIIEVLEKSDRLMEYQQYDIKVERCRQWDRYIHSKPGGLLRAASGGKQTVCHRD